MTRFLILSFAVLGWAFWELSGGADFEPPARPERIAEAAEPAPGNAPATPDLARREVAAERRVAPEPENTPRARPCNPPGPRHLPRKHRA